jgi:hypothetical protein
MQNSVSIKSKSLAVPGLFSLMAPDPILAQGCETAEVILFPFVKPVL